MKEDFYTEHRKNIKQAIENQRIIINGESIQNDENFVSSKKDDFPKPQVFLVFNSKDELEPHDFMKRDPLNINGYVKDWEIKELDLVHAERENELVIRKQFR